MKFRSFQTILFVEIDLVCASCHFDGLSNIEIGVEHYLIFVMIFSMFSFNSSKLRKQIYFCSQFRGDENNHNNFFLFDDQLK